MLLLVLRDADSPTFYLAYRYVRFAEDLDPEYNWAAQQKQLYITNLQRLVI
jgi:hypothetical protein